MNEDLFVCYYDWRKSCGDIVKQFLIPLLLGSRQTSRSKIDLLYHSMGGLVGHLYTGETYSYNIEPDDFGTKGSVKAYTWSMGEIMGAR